MLAISAGLHIVAIAFLIMSAKYFSVAPKVTDLGVTNVKLVEARPLTKSAMEQLPQQAMEKTPEIASIEPSEPARKPNTEIEQLKTVFAKAEPLAPAIQMKKRKQKPEKIEPRKKPAEAKPKTEKPAKEPEKKPNSNDFLEKRLAAIKKDLETKKSEKSRNRGASGLDTPAGSGSSNDVEIARWFEAVRNRINSRWSVFGDEQKAARVTIISIQIGDDGRLLDASIDSSSGDRFFDSSAMRAIHQAAPFPPMTADVSDRIKAAGGLALRFTPGGLQ
ncbi:MAG: TonB family protein [Deltaproteobacteria bacterium]|nr:TonB family protein [Deltaproteobacteria bacterium]